MTRVMAVLLVSVAALSSAASVRAEGPPAIDPGSGWYCMTFHEEFNPRDRSGGCHRTAEACAEDRQRALNSETLLSSIVSECRFQRKAAVVSYYDVMNDARRAWVLPSTELCQETRRFLQRDADTKQVSSCQLIGDVAFPPAAFQAARIPAGSRWYCNTRAGAVRLCARTAEACQATAVSCAPQPSGVALTWTPSERSGTAVDAAVALEQAGFAVFKSSADCERFRGPLRVHSPSMSACTIVGSRERPPLHRGSLPEGASWTCARAQPRPDAQFPDTCFRDEGVCHQVHGVDACVPATTAYVLTTREVFFAFATEAQCQSYGARRHDASRCEVVGAIGVDARPGGERLPEALDRVAIGEGVQRIKPDIRACGERFAARGEVKVSVRVAPEGSVESVTVKRAPEPGLGACVADALRAARFAPTRAGGSFGYPFVF